MDQLIGENLGRDIQIMYILLSFFSGGIILGGWIFALGIKFNKTWLKSVSLLWCFVGIFGWVFYLLKYFIRF